MTDSIRLSPVQQLALDGLLAALPLGNVLQLRSKKGRGRTTVLQALHRKVGGALIPLADFVDATARLHPLAIEDALHKILAQALEAHEHVLVDDFHVATAALVGCHFYPRSRYVESPVTALCELSVRTNRRLVFGTDGGPSDELIHDRCWTFAIGHFGPDDYRHLCAAVLGGRQIADFDFDKVHRFAPRLNARQLQRACTWLRGSQPFGTEQLIDYLRSQQLTSNVQLAEVAPVALSDLEGVDDVIRSLEANIVLPLENDQLAQQLDLKPKRGVLLAGPPGTGKTTIGRALAHRLKGKFFLIDGTFISGTEHFYSLVNRVFNEAQENAPAVIFIDDSDVIFESGREHGLYRYLLTMLDGLESKSAGRVCVMMTAMDVGNLPPAIIRSGRVELWLEMRLPDVAARRAILNRHCAALPPVLRGIDVEQLASATEGFTGADLKRVIEDGKTLYAYDLATMAEPRPLTEYFLRATTEVQSNNVRYAKAAAQARQHRPQRPPWFDVGDMSYGDDDE